jgi:NitT/TauT family transport system substrate-binding protein
MTGTTKLGLIVLLALPAVLAANLAAAADPVRVASGTPGDWDVSVSDFGQRAGIFRAKNIEIIVNYTDGSGATIQAVVSGSADIGIAVGVAGFLAPATKGAPLKMISAQYTGAHDQMWYVRASSAIHSFKDLKESNTVAYSTAGSSSNISGLAMLQQAGTKARMVATGGDTATMTQVMSGQIDVGYNTDGGLGFGAIRDQVRVIAKGDDLTAFRALSIRSIIANAEDLAKRRDVYVRYLQGYQQTLEWMYGEGEAQALQWYADAKHVAVADARRVRDIIYPKAALNLGPISQPELSIAQAVEFKRIDAPVSLEQFAKFQDILYTPAK